MDDESGGGGFWFWVLSLGTLGLFLCGIAALSSIPRPLGG